METRVLIRSHLKPNAVNPPPQWCSWWNLIMIGQLVSEMFMFESVDARTHARTQARVPYYKLTLSHRLWWANNSKILSEKKKEITKMLEMEAKDKIYLCDRVFISVMVKYRSDHCLYINIILLTTYKIKQKQIKSGLLPLGCSVSQCNGKV